MDYLIFWATAIGQGLSLLAGGYFARKVDFKKRASFFFIYYPKQMASNSSS